MYILTSCWTYTKEKIIVGKAMLYIPEHRNSTGEAALFSKDCPGYDMVDFSYRLYNPWEIKSSIQKKYCELREKYDVVAIMAKGVGAYFAIDSLGEEQVDKALFVSPVIDVECFIQTILEKTGISEDKLFEEQVISSGYDQDLSWEQYDYFKKNVLSWSSDADVIMGSDDKYENVELIKSFAKANQCELCIIEGANHDFDSPEQQSEFREWLQNKVKD